VKPYQGLEYVDAWLLEYNKWSTAAEWSDGQRVAGLGILFEHKAASWLESQKVFGALDSYDWDGWTKAVLLQFGKLKNLDLRLQELQKCKQICSGTSPSDFNSTRTLSKPMKSPRP